MVVILLVGYLSILFVANFTPAQRGLANVVERVLQRKLLTDVHIGRMELGLFNRVILHDVSIKDRHGETLLSADLLSAKIEYRALLERRISLRSVSLLDGDINLYKSHIDSAANYQFILDAFKSESEGPSNLNLTLNSLIIRRCHIAYNVNYQAHHSERLDVNHIDVEGLDANISLKCLTPDSINLRVRSFAFREQSGLDVRSLSFRLAANRRTCDISDFELSLPQSVFEEDELSAVYDGENVESFLKTIELSGKIRDARVSLSDIVCVAPVLSDFPYTFHLSTEFDVRPEAISLRDCALRESEDRLSLLVSADFSRRDGRVTRIISNLESLNIAEGAAQIFLDPIASDALIALVDRLGAINARAISTFEPSGESRVSAEFTSALGTLRTALRYNDGNLSGSVGSAALSLSPLFPTHEMPHDMDFIVDLNANFVEGSLQQADAKLKLKKTTYRDYQYKDVSLNAGWHHQQIQAKLLSTDPNASVEANLNGTFNGKKISALNFNTEIKNLNLAALNLDQWLGEATYSGQVQVAIPEIDGDALTGTLDVIDFKRQSLIKPEDIYNLSRLHLVLSPSRFGTHLLLDSDFARVELDGKPSMNAFKQTLSQLVTKAFERPADDFSEIDATENVIVETITTGKRDVSDEKPDVAYQFSFVLRRPDFFQQMLNLPLDFDGSVSLNGYISPIGGRSSVVASADRLDYGSFSLRRMRAYLHADDGQLSCLFQGVKRIANIDMKFALNAFTEKGVLHTDINWDDGINHSFNGQLQMMSDVSRRLDGGSQVNTQILPTTVTFGDTLWNVSAGNVQYADGQITVGGFRLSHADQSLAVLGRLSKDVDDNLCVMLQKVDVSYILSFVNLDVVKFSGLATGTICAKPSSEGHIEVDAQLHLPDFYFNDGLMGAADIKGRFSTVDKRLHLDADMQEIGVGSTKVQGYVGIGEKTIDLHVASKNTNLYFLRRYISDIFSNISGRTTGECHIYGPFKKIDFEGSEQANLYATINATGSSYHLSDGVVTITPGTFSFDNYSVTDDNKGTGTLNGKLTHNHIKDVHYDFTINASQLEFYNKARSVDLSFYATAYGTGRIRLYGRPGMFTADINIRPDAGTLFTYIVDTPEATTDAGLLQFRDKMEVQAEAEEASLFEPDSVASAKPARTAERKARKEEEEGSTDIYLNFLIDMDPAARLRVITDEKTGDNITLAGEGAIRATFYNKGSFQMFGTYTVSQGLFKMVIQEIFHKDFQIQRGGTIVFAGNPYEGDLNLQAVYTVQSATLADLGLNFSDKSVRADCVLNLGGKVKSPQITFDLSLPTVSEEVKQMVRQLITTEEDMNMQMLYLLGVGRFYNYDYASTDAAASGQSQGSVAMKSLLSSTLSGQLNNIISNAVGASNWTFGANLATGQTGWSDMEVGGALSGRLLNNRLLVNGVVGYRDRTTSTSNFVGDFDINYLLTPSGSVSLKAYSETNDRYFTKSSLTTQGIGILLKRDFSNFKDLFTTRNRQRQQKVDSVEVEGK